MKEMIFRNWQEEESHRKKDGKLPISIIYKIFRATRFEEVDAYVDKSGTMRFYDYSEDEAISYDDVIGIIQELVDVWDEEDWDNPPRGLPFTKEEKGLVFQALSLPWEVK